MFILLFSLFSSFSKQFDAKNRIFNPQKIQLEACIRAVFGYNSVLFMQKISDANI
jgi:hypothetical protein